jgi:RNA polymerase sigma-70 factor (ECF subfamily)
MISEQTIEQFKTGESKAFEIIYNEYEPKLLKFLQKRNVKDAKDIVEDTFIRLWDNRGSILHYKDLFNYLCTIALHIISDNRRHSDMEKNYLLNLYVEAGIEQESDSMEDELIAQDISQHIDCFMKKMSDRQQEIFNLSRKQGYTYKDIAKKLGIAEKTVEAHIHQILKALHEYFEKNSL